MDPTRVDKEYGMDGRTDEQMDGQMDGQSETNIPLNNLVVQGV